jgi:site-specific DNA-methyltransferase (adenine-specific)/adenine-specific DNA-methyltransferase
MTRPTKPAYDLTDAEKRDLTQLIAQGRPLPEQYRFILFDSRGWTNKLIWGDNKLILSSLKSGALRRQIEDAGGLKRRLHLRERMAKLSHAPK